MTTPNKRVLRDILVASTNMPKDHGIFIAPEDDNMYKVHFLFPGPPDTSYFGGLYHGMLLLNSRHPMGPPNIYMLSPSGRFNVEKWPVSPNSRGICTTHTSFHPEHWSPTITIETVILGFISLMCDSSDTGVGALNNSESQRRTIALNSQNFLVTDHSFNNFFPEICIQLNNGINPCEINNNPKIDEPENEIIEVKPETTEPTVVKKAVVVKTKTPKPKAEPKVAKPKAEPKVAEPKTPKPKAEPKTPKPKAEPKVVKPKAEPKVAKPKAEPKVAKPKAEPKVVKPKAEPKVVKPKAEPKVVKPKAEPKVAKPKAEPKAAKPKAEPKVAKPKAEPKAAKPNAAKPKAELKVVKPKKVKAEAKD
jgi:ubiquitin-protein ligase